MSPVALPRNSHTAQATNAAGPSQVVAKPNRHGRSHATPTMNRQTAPATSEVARFEDKVRREEARVAGQAELQASSLDAQFEELEDHSVDAEVAARLAALKGGGSAGV